MAKIISLFDRTKDKEREETTPPPKPPLTLADMMVEAILKKERSERARKEENKSVTRSYKLKKKE